MNTTVKFFYVTSLRTILENRPGRKVKSDREQETVVPEEDDYGIM